jgi:hypothetical protein
MASPFASTADCALERLGDRIRAERHVLARRWQESVERHGGRPAAGAALASARADDGVSDVIAEIAARLIDGAFAFETSPNAAVCAAALLGELRYTQRVAIGVVIDDLHALEDVLQAFIAEEARHLSPPIDLPAAAAVACAVRLELRPLIRHALEAYIGGYTRTIDGLTERLRRVSRQVIHDIRRPLSVLRVLARTLTVPHGDVDAIRMVEILDRSVLRLADVTVELDREAATSRPSGQ